MVCILADHHLREQAGSWETPFNRASGRLSGEHALVAFLARVLRANRAPDEQGPGACSRASPKPRVRSHPWVLRSNDSQSSSFELEDRLLARQVTREPTATVAPLPLLRGARLEGLARFLLWIPGGVVVNRFGWDFSGRFAKQIALVGMVGVPALGASAVSARELEVQAVLQKIAVGIQQTDGVNNSRSVSFSAEGSSGRSSISRRSAEPARIFRLTFLEVFFFLCAVGMHGYRAYTVPGFRGRCASNAC